ncbi:MAG: hypothetical protein ACI4QR_04240 [Eubacteriales bacterium]
MNITKNKKSKKAASRPFGEFACFILKLTVPMVLAQTVYLLYYILSREKYILVSNMETVYNIVESIMMSLMLSVGGSLFMDYNEKKQP